MAFYSCKIALLFSWNLGVWLLGLQPGTADTIHFRNTRQLNSFHIPPASWTFSHRKRKRKRKRPKTRTLRHMVMKRLRRWVLVRVTRQFQMRLRHLLLLLVSSQVGPPPCPAFLVKCGLRVFKACCPRVAYKVFSLCSLSCRVCWVEPCVVVSRRHDFAHLVRPCCMV